MPDYNLFSLSTRSFEQLVQALAAKLFGSNIIIFGDGPDGGREATFDGPVPYPHSTAPWQGFGILQAKFLQKSGGTGRDGAWAIQQLQTELSSLGDRARTPEYYVFITNVNLSAVEEAGAKDKVYELLNLWAESHGLTAFDVWDYDKLRVFLDNNREVAKAYAAGITSGDVLSRIQEELAGIPDFASTIANFLQKELRNDQFAQLEQAGHHPESQIPLSQVFVDLPVSEENLRSDPEQSQEINFLQHILENANERFDASSSSGADLRRARRVLVGGPGQGKTTLGQYLCQVYRAAILQSHTNVPVETRRIIEALRAGCEAEHFEFPEFRRFPYRFVLSSLASALASGTASSLFEYISQQIQKRTNRSISVAGLRSWFAAYPWLIVLDGLDEVPASSNRTQLLDSIHEFWIDLAECRADVFVIGTTRPQGYSEEFAPTYYRHHYLAPLSKETALRYGERLAANRYGATDRTEKVISRLTRACDEGRTAHLMRTPLQVTIMTSLVDKLGQAPDQRWLLFRQYYATIYDRELERESAASILRTHKSDIDAIHYRLGVVLQRESEKSGNTEARLDIGGFKQLVLEKLTEEGHEGPELLSLSNQIITAASDRLVFIVGVQDGQIGFEIRSLQEFMAAEGLMYGTDEAVSERLRRIARKISWRQVFLFAAGHCFSDRRHLRAFVLTLCEDTGGSLEQAAGSAILGGTVLALEMLEERISRGTPLYERLLIKRALTAFDAPDLSLAFRTAQLYNDEFQEEYQQAVQLRLGQQQFERRLGAWTCVLYLSEQGVGWAAALVPQLEQNLDELPNTFHAVLNQVRVRGFNRLKEAMLLKFPVPPGMHQPGWWNFEQINADHEPSWYPELLALLRYGPVKEVSVRIRNRDGNAVLRIGLRSVQEPRTLAAAQLPEHMGRGWLAHKCSRPFRQNPGKESLAKTIRAYAHEGLTSEEIKNTPATSWPLYACARFLRSAHECESLAALVEQGAIGDLSEWKRAEERWKSRGASVDDLARVTEHLPFDANIAEVGFPCHALYSLGYEEDALSNETTMKFLDEISAINNPEGRGQAAGMFVLAQDLLPSDESRLGGLSVGALKDAGRSVWHIIGSNAIAAALTHNDSVNILDAWDINRPEHQHEMLTKEQAEALLHLAQAHTDRYGIMHLAIVSSAFHGIDVSSLLAHLPRTDARDEYYATLAMVTSRSTADAADLACRIEASDDVQPTFRLLEALERSGLQRASKIAVLIQLINTASAQRIGLRKSSFELLNGIMAAESSDLTEARDVLGLPFLHCTS